MTMTLATSSASDTSIAFLDALFRRQIPEHVGFRFWDGSTWPDARPRAATFVLKHPGSMRAMFGGGTEKALAEALLRDDFDVEGDMESAFELADVLRQNASSHCLSSLRTLRHLQQLPRRKMPAGPASFSSTRPRQHSLQRDRDAVSFHYDVSNEFFALWLDRRRVYSCAYFEQPEVSLDDAQEAKLTHLCRKLRLRPGQRLLDIGCGWGALALFAADHFGVQVTGITLSAQQASYATAQVHGRGLEPRVTILLKDYRELQIRDPFDAIVSVGMAEHVGRNNLPGYFRTAANLLRPGGVFLNHAIGEAVRPTTRIGPSFIEEYVFPDSEIPPLPEVLAAAEGAGLEIRDVENLREHYTLTLRHWVRRLEAAHATALQHVSEATFRIWRLYMAGSARGFARGHLAVYQTLLSKPDHSGESHLPLTRRDWYERI